jgi:hypothetical protein
MGEFLNKLTTELAQFCPTFTQTPPQTPYPYITLEMDQLLHGMPWGPTMAVLTVKIWSRYCGTFEILTIAKQVEGFLQNYTRPDASLKLMESTLTLLKDGQTRQHCFRLKARLPQEA